MEIVETRKEPESVVKNTRDIPAGTVFTGEIDGDNGPWYRTIFAIINLREHGRSFTGTSFDPPDHAVYGYESRTAKVVLE